MDKASQNMVVDRGVALHKLIRLITAATCGGGYLNFMGNEFGHPEWIDFPRLGNDWSYDHARRQWSLADSDDLRYKGLENFDATMVQFIKKENVLKGQLRQLYVDEERKVLIFSRGNSIFAFNFNPVASFENFKFWAPEGKYEMAFNSDENEFGGYARLGKNEVHETVDGQLSLYLPSRVAIVLRKTL